MHAPFMATFLIADITGGYQLLVPLMVASAVTYLCVSPFERHSIYARKLAEKGDLLTHDKDASAWHLLDMSSLIETNFVVVRDGDKLRDLVEAIKYSRRNLFPVLDAEGRFQGVVTLDDVRSMMFDRSRYYTVKVYSIMKSAPAFVYMDEKMESVMNKFESTQAWNLPVLDDENKYLGFVSKSKIFSSYRDQLKAVSNE